MEQLITEEPKPKIETLYYPPKNYEINIENNYVQFYPFERVCCFSVAINFLAAVSPIPCWFSVIEGFLINPWYSGDYISWIWSNLRFLWLHPHRPPCDSFDTPSMEPHVPFLPPEFSCPMWFPPHCPLPSTPLSPLYPSRPSGLTQVLSPPGSHSELLLHWLGRLLSWQCSSHGNLGFPLFTGYRLILTLQTA